MKKYILILISIFILAGCSSEPRNAHINGVYMLLDSSGTYTKELTKAQHIINYTLAKLEPGDSFVVASIDTASFSGKDIIAKVTLDDRPSQANKEKRAFKAKVDAYVKKVKPSKYTDITGGILQATEYLNEKDPGVKTILIFSDLKEEIKKGYVRDIPFKISGFKVVALNVSKLKSDNVDPRKYMKRLDDWTARIEDGGGTFQVINDLQKLDVLYR